VSAQAPTPDLSNLIGILRDLIAWARLRYRGDYASLSTRLERLSARVEAHATRVIDPLRVANELEHKVLLDLVVEEVGDRELSQIVAALTLEGRRPLPVVYAALDRSAAPIASEHDAQVAVLKADIRSKLRAFGSGPTVPVGRQCLLALEELARLTLYTERWSLADLEQTGVELSEALVGCLSPSERDRLAHAADRALFDALVGQGEPRRLGQFGPRDWRPVHQRIRPTRWELEPGGPEHFSAPTESVDRAPRTPGESEARTSFSGHTDVDAPSTDNLAPGPGSPNPQNAGENGRERARTRQIEDPRASGRSSDRSVIKIGGDTIVQGGPGKPSTSNEKFWSGPGVPW
jgi:hypothetical protein